MDDAQQQIYFPANCLSAINVMDLESRKIDKLDLKSCREHNR